MTDEVWRITLRGFEFKFDEQDGELRVSDFNRGTSRSIYNTITRVEDVPGFARGWVRGAEAEKDQVVR